MMVAGEASGDLHGGHLAHALRRLVPDIRISGMGGAEMRKAGVDTLVDNAGVAVVGIWEVLAHFGEIKKAFDTLKDRLRNDPPALIVLIDYPDFNLRLAKVAKDAGVSVVYYISPQVWAWRRGRVRKIAKLVRKMLVVFPFEEKFYKESGVDCAFVGHPLLDEVTAAESRDTLAAKFGLDPARPVVGLLPGSRRKELYFHLPVMLEAFDILKKKVPGIQAVLPVAGTLGLSDLGPYMAGHGEVKLVEGDTPGVMSLMDAGMVKSGTATLQTALHKKPMVIIYRLSPLTYQIGRRLIKLKNIGMVNLIAGGEVVPELVQDAATPEAISSCIYKMICDKTYHAEMVARLEGVCTKLGGPGASARAAAEIAGLMGRNE
ncbi:MAG: lipid-A-disaccharide synthase [Nitrospirae bacterium]|nr:lipid-A-disaccharide synthase [Nitrospirota bacterium]